MRGELADFSRRLLRWYRIHRRELPWRAPKTATPRECVDPYLVFISEAMLQQTQVATVVPFFKRFIERFPSFESLAAADEQEVLRCWQGLGYYSRARNLQKAAMIVAEQGLPRDVEGLLRLPGVGRYTAGAVASIAFGCRAPILDGNVVRVLCRLDAIVDDPREPAVRDRLWTRAAEVLPRRGECGDFNSALMELGAMVCTPRSPKCLVCPVNRSCEAYANGLQERIPLRRKRNPTPRVERFTFCIHHSNQWLIEQRPAIGRWAGMWQFITRPTSDATALPLKVCKIRPLMVIEHALTHRRYRFHVSVCEAEGDVDAGALVDGRWITAKDIEKYPMSKPQLMIARKILSTV